MDELLARLRRAEEDAIAARTPVGGADRDTVEFRSELRDFRTETRAGFAGVRSEMRAEFAGVRSETQAGFVDVRAEVGEPRTRTRRDRHPCRSRRRLFRVRPRLGVPVRAEGSGDRRRR
jgi:hypothetical protein